MYTVCHENDVEHSLQDNKPIVKKWNKVNPKVISAIRSFVSRLLFSYNTFDQKDHICQWDFWRNTFRVKRKMEWSFQNSSSRSFTAFGRWTQITIHDGTDNHDQKSDDESPLLSESRLAKKMEQKHIQLRCCSNCPACNTVPLQTAHIL